MVNPDSLCMGCMNQLNGEDVCPVCGYDTSSRNNPQALPVKIAVNGRYVIGKVVAVSGEGITYIAWDKTRECAVNIKEYYPRGIVERSPDTSAYIPVDKRYVFNQNLLEFLEINRTLKNQSLASLQEVTDVFETNGTAYVVYKNLPCITLDDFLKRNGGTLKWEQARALLLPLIDTIKAMNDIGIVHKGISPKSIVVGRDGKLRITDYSISKLRMANDDLDVVLEDGYSAIEQYGVLNIPEGNYTDVYGFCATLFKVLIGKEIPKATLRLEDERLSIPSSFTSELPRHVLTALANGLKVKPSERTQDIESLKNELVYGEIVDDDEDDQATAVVTSSQNNEKNKGSIKPLIISAGITAGVVLIAFLILYFTVPRGDNEDTESGSSSIPVISSSTEQSAGEESIIKPNVMLYKVPDFTGKTYAEIMEMEEIKRFEIVIKNKVYSSSYAKGQICEQSIAKGTEVENETKIEVVISLGPKEFKMPNIVGLDEANAKIELLKAGFLYDNIIVLDKYDANQKPGVILAQEPEFGKKVNADMVVTIYKNSYTGETENELGGEPMGEGDDDAILEEYNNETSN